VLGATAAGHARPVAGSPPRLPHHLPACTVRVRDFEFVSDVLNSTPVTAPCRLVFRLAPTSSAHLLRIWNRETRQEFPRSGLLHAGETYELLLEDGGIYEFMSTIYPFMRGAVRVEHAAAAAAPSLLETSKDDSLPATAHPCLINSESACGDRQDDANIMGRAATPGAGGDCNNVDMLTSADSIGFANHTDNLYSSIRLPSAASTKEEDLVLVSCEPS
jgi:hypothetical protein